ncbi:MAG: hypothetical protein RIQ53_2845 [Pseudomonadota bacterium]|jgi:L-2-hydroxyglutarate oxidase LhgO
MEAIDHIDCVVIGAGVVGLAVARALQLSGRDTLVLEREDAIGTITSARNSEVIHAGIYYPAGSLKARLCVRGRALLYAYAAERGLPHRRCGKLIVATDAGQDAELDRIRAAALANGVDDLRRLTAAEAGAREPQLRCTAALESPSTGIIDSHALMLSLQGDLERAGGAVCLRSPVLAGRRSADGWLLEVGGAQPTRIACGLLVNSAGLDAPPLAAALCAGIEGLPADALPRARLAKGNYYALAGRAPFSRLVYPVPEPGGLGVHLTLDLGGQARFGPDVEWIDQADYTVDPGRAEGFYAAIRRYWPALPDGTLQPAYAGIRPKISGPGEPAADFRIDGPAQHGVPGLVQLFGIESPGLTASLAIADEVLARI